jgi:hypothetical protein
MKSGAIRGKPIRIHDLAKCPFPAARLPVPPAFSSLPETFSPVVAASIFNSILCVARFHPHHNGCLYCCSGPGPREEAPRS